MSFMYVRWECRGQRRPDCKGNPNKYSGRGGELLKSSTRSHEEDFNINEEAAYKYTQWAKVRW